jgi:acyl dehydratase
VTYDSFFVPADQRFFEDHPAGRVYEFGTITVSEPEIVDFAARYDPQYFHVDPVKAATGEFGGIIASGWHTIGLAMRLYVDHYLSHVASLASPGVDEIRWPHPLRPGDTVRIRVTILETRLSRSKPDRGIVRARVEAINQRHELVLNMTAVSILRRRERVEAHAVRSRKRTAQFWRAGSIFGCAKFEHSLVGLLSTLSGSSGPAVAPQARGPA